MSHTWIVFFKQCGNSGFRSTVNKELKVIYICIYTFFSGYLFLGQGTVMGWYGWIQKCYLRCSIHSLQLWSNILITVILCSVHFFLAGVMSNSLIFFFWVEGYMFMQEKKKLCIVSFYRFWCGVNECDFV